MKTRFDGTLWIGAGGTVFRPEEMETDHLLNTVKMLKSKPHITVNMIVRDIEAAPDFQPFEPFRATCEDIKRASLFNVTSMTPDQLADYALNSNLGKALKAELIRRGVNVENYLLMIESPETL